jgi:hypothetical protein
MSELLQQVHEREPVGPVHQIPILSEYLDTDGLAVALDVTPRTIIRWRLEKTGRPITHLGRRILYRIEGVRAWLAAQERTSERFIKRVQAAPVRRTPLAPHSA